MTKVKFASAPCPEAWQNPKPGLARKLKRLQEKIGVTFKRPALLLQALAHRSYVYEALGGAEVSNEKLEFLGDSVLGLVVSRHLLEKHPSYREGDLAKLKSAVVSTDNLARAARRLRLGSYFFISKGEAATGGRNKATLLADTLEAVIGACFVDRGLREAEKLIRRLLGESIQQAGQTGTLRDFKSGLQEFSQKHFGHVPIYDLLRRTGPAHAPLFEVQVRVADRFFGPATGRTKKEAEQAAARLAWHRLHAGQPT